jgi:CysZ protein
MINDFFSGTGYLLRGFRLVIRPELRRFILFPLLINIAMFTAAIWLGISYFETMLGWLLPEQGEWWFETARKAIWILFGAIIFMIVFFAFSVAANIIGAPFNGLLSEKVESCLSGSKPVTTEGTGNIISTAIPAVTNELKKLFYFLFWGIIVFIVLLIPGINIISPLAWAVFTSWMLALEYTAYPMENHNICFSAAKRELKKKKSATLGFGITVMFASAVPLVNFFVMPSAVAGATLMWVEHFQEQ